MAQDIDQLYQKGVAAIRAQDRDKARTLLEEVVKLDPTHEQAWLWLSAVVEDDQERIVCLNNVLTINPNNDEARVALEKLGGSLDLDTNAAGEPVPAPLEPHHEPEPPPKLEHATAPAVDSFLTQSGAVLKETATGKESASAPDPSLRSQILYGLMVLGMLAILVIAVVAILNNS